MIVLVSHDVLLPFLISTSSIDHHAPTVEQADKLSQNNSTNITLSKHIAVMHNSTEIRHIGFLKVHKAGSSTMQHIFRFGLKRNLTFLVPKKGKLFYQY